MLEYRSDEWGYRTLPNKMYELVKNSGDMHKTGTGYFTDAESEMLTILEYLNHGVKTNITESMIEQIEKAINDSLNMTLEEASGYAYSKEEKSDGEIPLKFLIDSFVNVAKMEPCVVRYINENYAVHIETASGKKDMKYFTNLQQCREYALSNGYRVKYPKSSADSAEMLEVWI